MNNLRRSCNYPLVHIAHMTEGGEKRRIGNIASESEVNENKARAKEAREIRDAPKERSKQYRSNMTSRY